ncbi:hypothetical protein SAY87_004750 [Trapa incisa]|uniref:BHLH domain-containing protein n=1 Tax=Trapa incisa TaxID=236973 RepID=A0AAN7JUX6_9MYRT|nr:hypothetical protein SAY87_004750 [Trapa incisa]
MYPSSSSSASHKSMPTSTGGLFRYDSAPGSLLTNAVDSGFSSHRDFSSVLGVSSSNHPHPPPHHHRPQPAPSVLGQYFSTGASSVASESPGKVNASKDAAKDGGVGGGGLQRSFGFHELSVGGGGSSSSSSQLAKQKSSPAGFLGHLTDGNAFSLASGSAGSSNGGHGVSRLKSQLSFTRQDSISQVSGLGENMVDRVSQENGHQSGSHSYATTGFGLDSWPENSHSIVFSAPSGKRSKTIDGDIYSFHPLDTQTTLEMATVEKLLHIPEDSVPCKIRAKRGFATHPRSIAERERRTRISGRLKKLQELVPNMDKQTSYADMLDLAVQHIKSLQTQVQKLRHDLDNCTCGCKRSS